MQSIPSVFLGTAQGLDCQTGIFFPSFFKRNGYRDLGEVDLEVLYNTCLRPALNIVRALPRHWPCAYEEFKFKAVEPQLSRVRLNIDQTAQFILELADLLDNQPLFRGWFLVHDVQLEGVLQFRHNVGDEFERDIAWDKVVALLNTTHGRGFREEEWRVAVSLYATQVQGAVFVRQRGLG